jgi:uncharacterized protein (TIGR03437 family)
MCHTDTPKTQPGFRFAGLPAAGLLLALWTTAAPQALAQSAALAPDWRRVGNYLVEAGLASPAGGPVERVWYAADGSRLYAQTAAGRIYETADFETWRPSETSAPPESSSTAVNGPEAGLRLRAARGARLLYAMGRAAYRSEDDGATWHNLTEYRGQSLIGSGLTDLAVSPSDPEHIAVANSHGVWRSLDGGLSWTGLNEGLPNLPVRRILRVPGNGLSARIELAAPGTPVEAEWSNGRLKAWIPRGDSMADFEAELRSALGAILQNSVTAVAIEGDSIYAGGEEGRFWVSADRGRTWRSFRLADAGTVQRLWVNPAEPFRALAALASPGADGRGARIARTINGGAFWDDLTANLPAGSAWGVTADAPSGSVYVAADAGVFMTYADLNAAGPATPWTPLRGRLPDGPARDVRLDSAANQLWVALDGHGVFATLAPHRFRDPRIVNAADHSGRPAAPGSLLSVLGSRVSQARVGELEAPVLAAGDSESQIQVPFEATGSSLRLALLAAAADGSITRREIDLALRATSPAIFLDKEGAPMVLDADRGLLLDAGTPARAGSRIQILATGLGKVTPDWPTGLAAPLDNPPAVVAPVRVFVDRSPVEVTAATLASGYAGFYLVEVQLPEIVNAGPAELYIEVGGQASGRVSLLLE